MDGVNVNAELVADDWLRYFRARAEGSRKSIADLLRQEMGLTIKEIMWRTPPFRSIGDQSFAGQKKIGNEAVARDIRRVFATPSEVYAQFADEVMAKAFRRAMARGNDAEAERLLRAGGGSWRNLEVIGGVAPQLHKRARNAAGRVSRHRPVRIAPAKERAGYVREVQRSVGFLKAGWLPVNAEARLRVRGVPAWIGRHVRRGRFVDRAETPGDPTVEIANLVRYAGLQSRRTGTVRYALAARAGKLKRQLEFAMGREFGKR